MKWFGIGFSTTAFQPNYKDDETEFTTKIAKLVNGMGMMLIDCYNKFLKAGDEADALSAVASVERMLPTAIGFLANDYDDVSAAIVEFCKLYIYVSSSFFYVTMDTHLAHVSQTIKNRARTDNQEQIVGGLLGTVIKKLKYDESYNFDSEGEDEADFYEFR
jgi:exportin-T